MKIVNLAIVLLIICAPVTTFASATVGQANSTSLSQGLVGYWPLDGATTNWITQKTFDNSGNGKTASIIGMSTTTTPTLGKIGQAFNFTGVNSKGLIIPSITTGTTFTYSAWIYASATTNGSDNYSNLFGDTGSVGIFYRMDLKKITYYFSGNHFNTSTLALNKWHHVVVVNNAGNVTFYSDGVADGTATGGISFNATAMGCDNNGANFPSNECFNGKLDDVRIYNRALSAGEVSQLYTLGTTNVAHSNNVTLSSGLVGYWPMDGSTINWAASQVLDLSGQGSTAGIVNLFKNTSPVVGKIGQALKFDGTSSYLLPSTTNLPTATGTISAWIKTPNAGSAYRGIVQRTTAYGMYLIGNVFGTYDNGGAANRLTGVALNDNKWHLVTMSFQSGVTNGTQLYIDGALSLTTTITATGQGTINIGMGQGGTPQIFNGAIDDVRMYNRVLSASEVNQLYDVGTTNVAHSNNVTLSTGLVGYWPFDGSATNWATGTTRDLSGSGNTGSLISMSTSTSVAIGKVGQAFKFNGVSGYVDAGSSASLTLNSWTASIWLKPTVLNAGAYQQILGGKYNFQFANLYLKGSNFGVYTSSDHFGSASLSAGQWAHVVVVVDSVAGTFKTYVNGVLDASTASFSPKFGANAGTVVMGVNPNSLSAERYNGLMDDVRIYSRALSAQEVAQLYAGGK